MHEIYLSIGVILTIFGLITLIYFVKFLKSTGIQHATVAPVSESLVTIFIGIFYVYCAIVARNQAAVSMPDAENATDNYDMAIMLFNETTTMETATEPVVTTFRPKTNDYLANYYSMVQQMLKPPSRAPKELPPPAQIPNNCESEWDFSENAMFLLSFLHCALTLLLNTTKPCKECNKSDLNQRNVESLSSNGSQCEIISNLSSRTGDKLNFRAKRSLIARILTIWTLPALIILLLYLAVTVFSTENEELGFKSAQLTKDTNLYDVINHRPNVTSNSSEIDGIIENIKKIINSTKTAPNRPIFGLGNRKPKGLCGPNSGVISRIYTFLVVLGYIVVILWAKMQETRLVMKDRQSGRQMKYAISSFAAFWSLAVADLLVKICLYDSMSANVASDVFRSFGNLNRVSIAGFYYFLARKMMKKFNLVEPKV